jgi:predicted S18 family serine protease
MELIEEVETKDRFKREQYYIDSLSTLSQIKCYFESEEEKIKYQTENYKEYMEKNKEKISERNREIGVKLIKKKFL